MIRVKDATKLFGIVILCACAVAVCSMFMNSNIDLARIEDQITDPALMAFYDTLVTSGNMTSAVTGGALLLTTLVMLLFYVKHYIDTHRAELGTLKALGYSNLKIAGRFWVFGLSVLVGTAVGMGIGFALTPMFYDQMRNDGVLPDISIHFNPEVVLFLVILPALAFALLAVVYSYFQMRRPALELIRGKAEKVKKAREGKTGKDLPFLREMRRATTRSRFALVFFIGFSALCYASTLQMAFSITEMASDMMAIMMMGIGFILALTTLFLAATTVIRQNTKAIAMLRVFGYADRECAWAILGGYRPIAYVGFAIGTAYQYGLMKMMVSVFYDTQDVVAIPEYNFDVPAFLIVLATFVVIYEATMLYYGSRMKKVPLKEVMMGE